MTYWWCLSYSNLFAGSIRNAFNFWFNVIFSCCSCWLRQSKTIDTTLKYCRSNLLKWTPQQNIIQCFSSNVSTAVLLVLCVLSVCQHEGLKTGPRWRCSTCKCFLRNLAVRSSGGYLDLGTGDMANHVCHRRQQQKQLRLLVVVSRQLLETQVRSFVFNVHQVVPDQLLQGGVLLLWMTVCTDVCACNVTYGLHCGLQKVRRTPWIFAA